MNFGMFWELYELDQLIHKVEDVHELYCQLTTEIGQNIRTVKLPSHENFFSAGSNRKSEKRYDCTIDCFRIAS